MRYLGSILCGALFAFGLHSAVAQEAPPPPQRIPVYVDPPPSPFPEAEFRGEARTSFLQNYVQLAEVPRAERDRAYRRLIALHDHAGNGRAQREWTSRHRTFVLTEGAAIEQELIASPVTVCTPPAEPQPNAVALVTYCGPDSVADLQRADDWDLLGRAYTFRGDEPRRIAALEAETLLRRSRLPEERLWIRLAEEAADAGQFEAALRYCATTSTAPIYAAYPSERTRRDVAATGACAADVHFLMGHWQEWLSHYEPLIRGAYLRDAANVARLCVATTHLNRPSAGTACDWARTSVALRDEDETRLFERMRETARQRRREGLLRDATEEIARMRLTDWEQDKVQLNAAINGCSTGATAACRLPPPRLTGRRL